MAASETFLKIIGQAVIDAVGNSVFDDFVIERSASLADQVWKLWQQASPDVARKHADLEAVIGVSWEEADNLAGEVVRGLGSVPEEMKKSLRGYLRLVPGAVRKRCRRPSRPDGVVVPK